MPWFGLWALGHFTGRQADRIQGAEVAETHDALAGGFLLSLSTGKMVSIGIFSRMLWWALQRFFSGSFSPPVLLAKKTNQLCVVSCNSFLQSLVNTGSSYAGLQVDCDG